MDRSRKLLQVEQDNSLQVLKQGDPQGQMIFNTYQSDIDPRSPGNVLEFREITREVREITREDREFTREVREFNQNDREITREDREITT